MNTTLNEIRKHSPCSAGWQKLLAHIGKTAADDEPLSIANVIDSNGLNDALWCLRAVTGHDREIRLYACWCARQVWHLLTDERSRTAVEVAEQFANGNATAAELDAASDAASDAAYAADAARAAAYAADAARAAAYAARDAAYAADAASAAARDAQSAELRRVCAAIEAGQDPYPKQGDKK